MWTYYNPNPRGIRVGDCSIRAVSRALDQDWTETYINICLEGILQADMPSSNAVWGEYLRSHGFSKGIEGEHTTVKRFCEKHNNGIYVCALSGHVVTVVDGDFFDTWDSSDETVIYYWKKEED